MLTLYPELFDPRVHLGRFEAHTEGGQDQDGHEKNLPSVAVEDTAEPREPFLQPSAGPQRRSPSPDSPLKKTTIKRN